MEMQVVSETICPLELFITFRLDKLVKPETYVQGDKTSTNILYKMSSTNSILITVA